MSERRESILAEVRERGLEEEFADAVVGVVVGEAATVYWSAVECNPYRGENGNAPAVVLALIAATDEQVEAALALLPPREEQP